MRSRDRERFRLLPRLGEAGSAAELDTEKIAANENLHSLDIGEPDLDGNDLVAA